MPSHQGRCHCGAVSFEVESDLKQPLACNCSMCGRAGTLLVFVPEAAFRLVSGEDALTDYQFGKRHIHHQFCKTCGIKPFGWGLDADGHKMFAVNVRCVDGVDVRSVEPQWYDGASI